MEERRRTEEHKADEVRRLELVHKEEELLARERALEEAHFYAAEMRPSKEPRTDLVNAPRCLMGRWQAKLR